MPREIKLSGGEITIVKSIGFGGAQLLGKLLIERTEDMVEAEFLDTLDGLISLGYVLSTRVNVRKMEDVERAFFRINPTFARDLKESIQPRGRDRKNRRERRG